MVSRCAAVRRRLSVTEGRRDGRWIPVAAIASYLLLLLLASRVTDMRQFWRGVLFVAAADVSFLDTRVWLSGLECHRLGYDSLVDNPCDPWQRPMNYPRIWLALAPTGLGQEATNTLGVAQALAFWTAVLLVTGRLSRFGGTVLAALLCSPTAMLLVERGNNDIVVFCLITASLVLVARSAQATRASGYALLLLAGVLKIYPFVTLGIVVREAPRRALALAGVFALVVAAYGFSEHRDIARVARVTVYDTGLSYGVRVFPARVGQDVAAIVDTFRSADPAAVLRVAVPVAAFVAALLWMISTAKRLSTIVPAPGTLDRRSGCIDPLDALRAGGLVFLGTFVLGQSSWDYRLVFLLFAVPELLRRIERDTDPARLASTGLVAMLASFYLGARSFLNLDEVANWIVAFCLIALLWTTRPWGGRKADVADAGMLTSGTPAKAEGT